MAVAFDEARIWPAAKAAGMLTRATWSGSPAAEVWVDYRVPGAIVLNMVSSEHTAEYQHSDMPTLSESDELILSLPDGDRTFKVRKPTMVPEFGATGFFRVATLTEVR